MTLLAYDQTGSVDSRLSILAFFGLGAGILNTAGVIVALYFISQLDSLSDRVGCIVALLLETAPIVFFALWPVARVMKSCGRLRGLLPATIGAFLANISGLLAILAGAAYGIRMLDRL